MARGQLPPGIRFHPTDEELLVYYLRRKVQGKKLHFKGISVVDIYKYAPWDLPAKSGWRSGDKKWYFFCLRKRKYASGSRMDRSTDLGYWKTTGKDRSVKYRDKVVGTIKTLVFHRGKPPKGVRSDWVMYEYDLIDDRVDLSTYVLCAVFEKDGKGPRIGAQYGAPFCEEDWIDDDVTEDVNESEVGNFMQHALSTSVSVDNTIPTSTVVLKSSGEKSKHSVTTGSMSSEPHADISQHLDFVEDDELDPLLYSFREDDHILSYNDLRGDLGKSALYDESMAYASTSNATCPANFTDDNLFVELRDLDDPLWDTETLWSAPSASMLLGPDSSCSNMCFGSQWPSPNQLNVFTQSAFTDIAQECGPCAENASAVGENEVGTSGKTR